MWAAKSGNFYNFGSHFVQILSDLLAQAHSFNADKCPCLWNEKLCLKRIYASALQISSVDLRSDLTSLGAEIWSFASFHVTKFETTHPLHVVPQVGPSKCWSGNNCCFWWTSRVIRASNTFTPMHGNAIVLAVDSQTQTRFPLHVTALVFVFYQCKDCCLEQPSTSTWMITGGVRLNSVLANEWYMSIDALPNNNGLIWCVHIDPLKGCRIWTIGASSVSGSCDKTTVGRNPTLIDRQAPDIKNCAMIFLMPSEFTDPTGTSGTKFWSLGRAAIWISLVDVEVLFSYAEMNRIFFFLQKHNQERKLLGHFLFLKKWPSDLLSTQFPPFLLSTSSVIFLVRIYLEHVLKIKTSLHIDTGKQFLFAIQTHRPIDVSGVTLSASIPLHDTPFHSCSSSNNKTAQIQKCLWSSLNSKTRIISNNIHISSSCSILKWPL